MTAMATPQQAAQMRQARPTAIPPQQVRPSQMAARPITGQQPLALPQQRPAGSVKMKLLDMVSCNLHVSISD